MHFDARGDEEKVVAFGRPRADVGGLGPTEILGSPQQLDGGIVAFNIARSILAAGIDDEDLQHRPRFGTLNGGQSSAQRVYLVVGDHDYRNAERDLDWLRGQFGLHRNCGLGGLIRLGHVR